MSRRPAPSAETLTALDRLETHLRGVVDATSRVAYSDVGERLARGIAQTLMSAEITLQAIGEWKDECDCHIWLHDGSAHCWIHGTTYTDDGREDCRVPVEEGP